MPVRNHVGALLRRPPGPRYVEALRFAELDLHHPLPRAATLRRWRASLPEDFVVSLRVPAEALYSARGPLHLDEELEAALRWLREAADAVGAALLVVPTGSQVTTGQRSRDRLARYFERLTRLGRPVVWAPDGLWRADLAVREAERHGVVYAVDPLEDEVPPGPLAYLRLKALGARTRFSEGLLLDVADRLDELSAEERFVVFDSPRSFREASRLAALLSGEGGEAADLGEEAADLERDEDEPSVV